MKEIYGNAWTLKDKYTYLAITTNGTIKKDGSCVMGAGIALEAKKNSKYSRIPYILGDMIKANGNIVHKLSEEHRLISFPVKHNWFEDADIELIKKSAYQLMDLLKENETVLLPRPGCGNGHLKWNDVKPHLEHILDDRVFIVHFKEGE